MKHIIAFLLVTFMGIAAAAEPARPGIFVQTGHGLGIHAVAYSTHGKFIATGAPP